MASGKTLYIKGDRDVEVTKPDVTLGDLLSMECSDQFDPAEIENDETVEV